MVKLTGIIEFMKRTELMDAIVRIPNHSITKMSRAQATQATAWPLKATAWPLKPRPGHLATIKKMAAVISASDCRSGLPEAQIK